jgi:hypothetical protein
MERMLDTGKFILVGFVEENEGIRPVSFTFGQGFDVAEAVNQITSGMAVCILENIQNLLTQKKKAH